jgi:predicted component of type VI protein secretion system
MPRFLVKFGVAVIKEVQLKETAGSVSVGRKPDNDIVIDNQAISGHHLRFLQENGKFFVEDLNSTNGTFLNGQKILKAEMHDKDQIHLATPQPMSHTIVFVNETEQYAPPAAKTPAPATSEETVIIDPARQKELMEQLAKQAKGQPGAGGGIEKVGWLKVVDGAFDGNELEFEVTKLVTYIGKGEQCDVRIRGLFAPEVAAAINRRPEAYRIIAVKEGYPKVNGAAIKAEQQLKEGDTIEAGKTKMVFLMKDKH